MIHTNGTNKLQIVTSSSAGLDVVINYSLQNNQQLEKSDLSKISSATTTDIALPDAGDSKILALNIVNTDPSVSNTVTVQQYTSSTAYLLFKAPLAAGEKLVYNGEWSVFTVDGKFKVQHGSVAGGGDMLAADYDPANIAEQVVGETAVQTMTNKRITQRVTSEVSSATPTIDSDTTDNHSITALAADITSFTTNLSGTPTNFQRLIVRIKDNGTSRAITWGAGFEAKGVALPTNTTINKTLNIGFMYDTASSKWGCVAVSLES